MLLGERAPLKRWLPRKRRRPRPYSYSSPWRCLPALMISFGVITEKNSPSTTCIAPSKCPSHSKEHNQNQEKFPINITYRGVMSYRYITGWTQPVGEGGRQESNQNGVGRDPVPVVNFPDGLAAQRKTIDLLNAPA